MVPRQSEPCCHQPFEFQSVRACDLRQQGESGVHPCRQFAVDADGLGDVCKDSATDVGHRDADMATSQLHPDRRRRTRIQFDQCRRPPPARRRSQRVAHHGTTPDEVGDDGRHRGPRQPRGILELAAGAGTTLDQGGQHQQLMPSPQLAERTVVPHRFPSSRDQADQALPRPQAGRKEPTHTLRLRAGQPFSFLFNLVRSVACWNAGFSGRQARPPVTLGPCSTTDDSPPSTRTAPRLAPSASWAAGSGLRRTLVALRQADLGAAASGHAPLAPSPGLADIERLAAATAERPGPGSARDHRL